MKKFFSIIILCSILFVQNSAFAIQQSDISVVVTPTVLSSRLKKEYVGYEYLITNKSKSRINLVNAQIVNGENGTVAYSTVESGGGKAIGVLWIVCAPLGLFTFGIGWIVGVIGTPIAWFVGNHKDKKAKRESVAYNNLIQLGELPHKESISVMTLVPIGAKPQLKLSILDSKKEYHNFVY